MRIWSSPVVNRYATVLVSALLGFWAFAAQRLVDQDLYGHLVFGRAAIAAGGVLKADPYSYVTTLPVWYNHEWLFEVTSWLVYSTGGDAALLVLKAMFGAVTFALLAMVATRRGGRPLIVLLTLALAGAGMMDHLHVRPYLVTYAGFAATLLLLDMVETGRRWPVAVLTLLFAFWANCHAAFVVGLGLSVLYGAVAFVQKDARWKTYLLVACLGTLAACINPYGIAYWPFVLKAVTMKRNYITEFAPVPWNQSVFIAFKAMVILSVPILLLARRRPLVSLVILAVTAYLALTSYRHMPLFLMAASAYLPEMLTEVLSRLAPRFGPVPVLWTHVLLAMCGVAAIALCVTGLAPGMGLYAPMRPCPEASFFFPGDAVRFIKKNHIHGNIAAFFDWGEFLIWELPDSKVSFDGRLETIYPPRVVEQNLAFTYGEPDGEALLTEYPTDLVLTDVRTKAFGRMMQRRGWVGLYRDAGVALFIRRELMRSDFQSAGPIPGPALMRLSGPPSLP